MDMTGQGRAKRAHHQLPMFIEIVMDGIVSVGRGCAQANFLRQQCDQNRRIGVYHPPGIQEGQDMKYSWIAVLAGLPLIIGAGLPLDRPIPRSQPADVQEVSFLDRLLQDGRPKRASSNQRRGSSSRGRNTIPKPPALASVPVPIPKPAPDATTQAGSPPDGPQQADGAPSKPPASETPPPAAQNQTSQGPDSPPATAPVAEPPVVEQPGTATKPPYEAEVPKPLAKPDGVSPAAPDE